MDKVCHNVVPGPICVDRGKTLSHVANYVLVSPQHPGNILDDCDARLQDLDHSKCLVHKVVPVVAVTESSSAGEALARRSTNYDINGFPLHLNPAVQPFI